MVEASAALLVGVVLAGSGAGVAVGIVAELAEHPRAENGVQTGLGQVDPSARVLAKLRLDPPLYGLDLVLQDGQDGHLGAYGGGVGGGDYLWLAQLLGAQRGGDRRSLSAT